MDEFMFGMSHPFGVDDCLAEEEDSEVVMRITENLQAEFLDHHDIDLDGPSLEQWHCGRSLGTQHIRRRKSSRKARDWSPEEIVIVRRKP